MNQTHQFCKKAIAYLKVEEVASTATTIALPDSQAPVLTDIGHGLLVAYVVNQENQLTYVQNHHLSEANMDEEVLYQTGVANLANLIDDHLTIRQYGPVFGVFLENNFEASLILVNELWDSMLAHLIKNSYVAALPCRDVLAFCDSHSPDGIATLREMIVRSSDASHKLSNSLFQRQGGKWSLFQPQ